MRYFYFAAQCLLYLFLIACDGSKSSYKQVEITGATMGTFYSIKVVHSADQSPPNQMALKAAIDALLVDINNSMSTYIPESELSKLNRMGEVKALALSAPLFEVLQLSQSISQASDGAFDVTVHPLVELWGFGASKTDRTQAPSDAKIADVLRKMGYQKLLLDTENRYLSRPEGITVDLSAVAKGYGVDLVSEKLSELGHTNYMVEIGGEVRAKGVNRKGDAWRIGVETPAYSLMSAPQGPALIVQLSDRAMATSGDYRNYYEVDGQRFSHTIDPKTGRPIKHNLASATVIMPDCASADAWATAFNVMGVEAALTLANERDIAAFFIVKSKNGFETRSSDAFAKYQH